MLSKQVGAGMPLHLFFSSQALASLLLLAPSHCRSSPEPVGLRIIEEDLMDRNVSTLPGSTGHAPGYVGQYNTLPALTELAKRRVGYYSAMPNAFSVVRGLEIAQSSIGLQTLRGRCEEARKLALEAEMVDGVEAVHLAP
ncbi:hypothetical protein NDA11_001324 [Ustilago hordei]|nr:hypothetical protein NDA10_007970 [Ustilago hordei]KAJ1572334.1 hypothetical protein NDA11_001324 [Ustilago hordei]KAJ1591456.1 hypothetical protein NDA15_006252 [Ustilago hordei]KAJ1593593.1 hypothetical protein NDA12_000439 [Ustilago hordei]KAJ1604017.1 hypothetical protein NDA14_004661 [Ustilago hordei]